MSLRTALILTLAVVFAAAGSYGQIAVVNGASFTPGAPVAPGSIASIFGENLCRETAHATWVGPGQLPTTLGDCAVAVNGLPAMLHYVSRQQINFVVPPDTFPGMAEIRVRNENEFRHGSVKVEQAAPGVFAMNGMGLGEGAVLHGTLWSRGPFSAETGGHPTALSVFATGLDPSVTPIVLVAGIPVKVTYYGEAPGFVGLQQINIELPPAFAGVGCVPLTIRSRDRVSNVTEITLLPNDAQMHGMPGWGPGNTIHENQARGQDLSALAYNPVTNTALVTDEEGDVIRVISLASKEVVASIALPEGSGARAIAVNEAGTIAAATLSKIASVALVDLTTNTVSTVETGHFACRIAFHGNDLLVTNSASGTVTVIDTATHTVKRTVAVEFGACGIAVVDSIAVVANLQSGSTSIISLINYSVVNIALGEEIYPKEVAISASTMKAAITLPMTNAFLILDLQSREVKQVNTELWSALGPGSVVANGNLVYIANQMSASVSVADLMTAKVIATFPVDPGPRDLALNVPANQLLVLSEATGTLSLVSLESYTIIDRILAIEAEQHGHGGKH